MYDKFLELMQATEALRKCEGKACLEILEETVEQARSLESTRSHHEKGYSCSTFSGVPCLDCDEIHKREIALRETLHSQGVDFPLGLLDT